MWIRYTKEEYEELKRACEQYPPYLNDIQLEAKWIKRIVDACDENESYERKL